MTNARREPPTRNLNTLPQREVLVPTKALMLRKTEQAQAGRIKLAFAGGYPSFSAAARELKPWVARPLAWLRAGRLGFKGVSPSRVYAEVTCISRHANRISLAGSPDPSRFPVTVSSNEAQHILI